MRFPEAAKTALAIAGAIGGNPGSPTPPGFSLFFKITLKALIFLNGRLVLNDDDFSVPEIFKFSIYLYLKVLPFTSPKPHLTIEIIN